MFKGMQQRMKKELSNLVPEHLEVDPYVLEENPYAAWEGASIMADLSSFESMWICTKYFQDDPNIIHKKCF